MKGIDQKIISAGVYKPRFAQGTPFIVEGCMVMMCTKGSASLSLDFRQYEISAGDVIFLFSDMVIELGRRSDDFELQYVNINPGHALEIYISITSQRFWDKLYLSPVLKLNETYSQYFSNWIAEAVFVYDFCHQSTSDTVIASITKSLFQVMEDMISRNSDKSDSTMSGPAWNIVGKFMILLSRYYTTQHRVRYYADALNITPDYFSAAVKSCMGASPKDIINNKLVLAIKGMLENTDLTIKDIAERLNYEDTSYLCKVFRRHTGMSPIEYRKLKSKPPKSLS